MKNIIYFLFLINFLYSFSQETPQLFLEEKTALFPNVRDIAFNDNGNEVIFSVQNYTEGKSVLVSVKKNDGRWSKPNILPFSGLYNDLEPYFSEDGLTLYFASNRSLDSTNFKPKDFDIWFVKRNSIEAEWQSPINMGAPINSELDEFYPIITNSGNVYFTSVRDKKNKDDIFICRLRDGNYEEPEALGSGVNTEGYEFNAFVAPDESFIIFTGYNRDDGFGSGDLYISYYNGGEWGTAKNLGTKINSNKMDYCPYVDIDKGVLYFTSKRMETLPMSETLTIDEILNWKNKGAGLSKLYSVDFISGMNRPSTSKN